MQVINHRQPCLLRLFDHAEADADSELGIHLAELMTRTVCVIHNVLCALDLV